MKLWIASANREDIEKASIYPIKGIITNPTVIAEQGKPWSEVIADLNELGIDPLHLRVVSTRREAMLLEWQSFRKWVTRKPLIAKIPMCRDGIGIIRKSGGWAMK